MSRRYHGGRVQPGTADRHDVDRHTVGLFDRVRVRAGAAVQGHVWRGVHDQGRRRRGGEQRVHRDGGQDGHQVLQFVQHEVRQRGDGTRGEDRHRHVQCVYARPWEISRRNATSSVSKRFF